MGTVLLVRHAETAWNREGRVQGWAPTTLTDRGREQARTLAVHLAGEAAMADTAPVGTNTKAVAAAGHAARRADATAGTVNSADRRMDDPSEDNAGLADAGNANRTGACIDVDRVIASDLRRARETAQAVETAIGRQPTFDSDWRERHVGRLQGLPASELFERHPHLSLKYNGEDAARRRPEGGETLLETRDRVLDAWERLRADLAVDETAVVITHSGPISLLLGHLRNESLTEAILEREQANGAVNELQIDDDVRLLRENWTTYLDPASEG